jgi:hypothetical protein
MLGESARGLDYYRRAIAEYEAIGDIKDQGLVVYHLAVALPFGPEQAELILQGLSLARQAQDAALEGFLLHL